jgi:hypothetical protein
MSLVYDKMPGEWHGPGSISLVIRDLNKLYQPCVDLQITHFSDGCVYFEDIKKTASRISYNWINKISKHPRST